MGDAPLHAAAALPLPGAVLAVAALAPGTLESLFGSYGLAVQRVAEGAAIPGSYWGEPEAGLIGAVLFLRADTPVHSALHEACHFICMPPERRLRLDTDAGGDDDEENAVNYLSLVLAGTLPGVGRCRMLADMDAWGYSFRLGSARAWFERDAEDACAWLHARGLLGEDGMPRPPG